MGSRQQALPLSMAGKVEKPLYPNILTPRNSPDCSSEKNLFPLPNSSPALCLLQVWLSSGT